MSNPHPFISYLTGEIYTLAPVTAMNTIRGHITSRSRDKNSLYIALTLKVTTVGESLRWGVNFAMDTEHDRDEIVGIMKKRL